MLHRRLAFLRADSKQLKESARDSLFDRIKSDGRIGYAIDTISPESLSACMLQRVPISLNTISHESAMNLIRAVMDRGVRVAKVFVDTVGDPGAYQAKLTRAFDRSIVFTVSKKADSLFKTVSAASICAKVTRDRVLREWRFREPLLAARQGGEGGAGAAAGAAASAVAETNAEPEPADGDGFDGSDEEDSEDDAVVAAPAKRSRSAAAEADAKPSSSSSSSAAGGARKAAAASTSSEGKGSATASSGAAASRRTAASRVAGTPEAAALHPMHASSGYPGDPATKEWLDCAFDRVFGWPSVLRFSWATAKDRLDASGVPVEWEEEEQGAGGAGAGAGGAQMGLGSFFAAAPAASRDATSRAGGAGSGTVRCAMPLMARAPFYRKRWVKQVTDI